MNEGSKGRSTAPAKLSIQGSLGYVKRARWESL